MSLINYLKPCHSIIREHCRKNPAAYLRSSMTLACSFSSLISTIRFTVFLPLSSPGWLQDAPCLRYSTASWKIQACLSVLPSGHTANLHDHKHDTWIKGEHARIKAIYSSTVIGVQWLESLHFHKESSCYLRFPMSGLCILSNGTG